MRKHTQQTYEIAVPAELDIHSAIAQQKLVHLGRAWPCNMHVCGLAHFDLLRKAQILPVEAKGVHLASGGL